MATVALYFWGCLGGAAMAFVVFTLPVLTRMADGSLDHKPMETSTMVLLVVSLAAIGGIVALTLDDGVSRGQAILSGIASQTFIKGIVSAGREALPLTK